MGFSGGVLYARFIRTGHLGSATGDGQIRIFLTHETYEPRGS